MNNRTSPIWKLSTFDFNNLCKTSTSYSDIIRYFGLQSDSGNFITLKTRIKEDNIDVSHITESKKGKPFPFKEKRSISDITTENSTYNRTSLKKRLLKENLLKNECYICGLKDTWNNKPINLRIDHINGISNDNRLENLRILCPNCDSQLDTFSGRNRKDKNKKNYCLLCKVEIHHTSTFCLTCSNNHPNRSKPKIEWPSTEILLELLTKLNYVQLGKYLNVSDNAIRKHLEKLNIELPTSVREKSIIINKENGALV